MMAFLFFLWFAAASSGPADSVDVRVEYKGSANAVFVAGSFNGWSANRHRMQPENGRWTVTLRLEPGYYYYKIVADGVWMPDPDNSWRVNDGGTSWNSILKAGNPPVPRRLLRREPFDTALVPRPVYPSRPDLIRLYDAAWAMAWQKIRSGTASNGFAPAYLDEGFNEWIYQWDSCFMSAFAVYGEPAFPAMAALDNFYAKQRADGYIQRVYSETAGEAAGEPSAAEPMVNPPLFAWMEWRYFRLTGDKSRLQRVFPVLDRYFSWMETNTAAAVPGLFRQTDLGSGMDNVPRPDAEGTAWIDASAQMAHFARMMQVIAEETGRKQESVRYAAAYKSIAQAINGTLWSPSTGFYHDLTRSGSLSPVHHAGAFWMFLTGAAGPGRNKSLVRVLEDPRHFNRPHRIPALSASDPLYNAGGHYWRGGIWAPVNYMTIAGLNSQGYRPVADSIALNHLNAVSRIYSDGIPTDRQEKIPFEQRFDDGYHTLWEAYAPEKQEPATRWDDTFYTRQDFAGWSALGPVALLIEQVIGLDIDLASRSVTWHLNGVEERGLRNLRLGGHRFSFHAVRSNGRWDLTIASPIPLDVTIMVSGRAFPLRVTPERTRYQVKAEWK